MLPTFRKAVLITLVGLLLFGIGLDRTSLNTTLAQQTEESIEIEFDEAIEIRQQTIRQTKKHQLHRRLQQLHNAEASPLAHAHSHAPVYTRRFLMFRSLLI